MYNTHVRGEEEDTRIYKHTTAAAPEPGPVCLIIPGVNAILFFLYFKDGHEVKLEPSGSSGGILGKLRGGWSIAPITIKRPVSDPHGLQCI